MNVVSWVFASISYDPLVRIDLGPLALSPHGIFTAVGIAVGAVLLVRDSEGAGLDGEEISSVLTRAVVAALIGARLAYVVNHLSMFDNPLEVLRVWEGGASLLGGLTAALIVTVGELRRRKLPVLPCLDLAAPWFTLGIAVGRIGDLIIADHLGDKTDFALGFKCPDVVDVGENVGSFCPAGQVVHLTAAYDLVVAALITVVVLVIRKRARRPGVAIGAVGFLYGLDRLVLDVFRADATRFGLTGSQWTGVALVTASTALLLRTRRPVAEPEHERKADPDAAELDEPVV